ncbi:MAG: hypothetical protein ACKVOR_05235 [Flavobacteriales bacterium]
MTTREILFFIVGVGIGAFIVYLILYRPTEDCITSGGMKKTLSEAQTMISDYNDPSNTNKLMLDSNTVLEGWRLERCALEQVFNEYDADASGVQLYLAKNSLDEITLVWVPSGTVNKGNIVDIIDASDPMIVDMTNGCPHNCPPAATHSTEGGAGSPLRRH